MFLLYVDWSFGKIAALITFAIAAFTDYLDGWLAKTRGLISDFGKFMDPIADKILVIAAFLAFVELRIVPAWAVVIIIFREFIITGLRLLGIVKGHIVPATRAGKHKTVSQTVTIFVVLIYLVFLEHCQGYAFWVNKWNDLSEKGIHALVLFTVSLTLVSGISYLVKNKRLFYEDRN